MNNPRAMHPKSRSSSDETSLQIAESTEPRCHASLEAGGDSPFRTDAKVKSPGQLIRWEEP